MSSVSKVGNLLVMALLLQAPAVVLAGSGYDACQAEEKRLRAEEAQKCSGASYIFNPSDCFNTRKALGPYSRGKCREVAGREGVQLPETVKPGRLDRQGAVGKDAAATAIPTAVKDVQSTGTAVVYDPRAEIERLQTELAELKAELLRLKEEVSRLRLKRGNTFPERIE